MKNSQSNYHYTIIAKTHDREIKKFIFTLHNSEGRSFNRTAEQIFRDKEMLSKLSPEDAYDIGFNHGFETIVKIGDEIVEIKKSSNEIIMTPAI